MNSPTFGVYFEAKIFEIKIYQRKASIIRSLFILKAETICR